MKDDNNLVTTAIFYLDILPILPFVSFFFFFDRPNIAIFIICSPLTKFHHHPPTQHFKIAKPSNKSSPIKKLNKIINHHREPQNIFRIEEKTSSKVDLRP